MGNIIIEESVFNVKQFHQPSNEFAKLSNEQMELVAAFNKKLAAGEFQTEKVPCLCGSEKFNLIASVDYYSFTQNTVICVNCGLIQSNPRLTQKSYQEFYTSDTYRLCYEGGDFLEVARKRMSASYGKHIFDEVNSIKAVGHGVKVLEVGAGGGWNLMSFKNAGANVLGMDYSPGLVKFGNESGIQMKEGGLDAAKGKYDVIILNHVFEHLLDPIANLKFLADRLTPGGVLYIAVPNILNFGIGQLQNAHTYYFSPDTFKFYVEHAGFRLLKFGEAASIHMFGIFSVGQSTVRHPSLAGHYRYLRKMLAKQKLKHQFINLLRLMGVYSTIQRLRKP